MKTPVDEVRLEKHCRKRSVAHPAPQLVRHVLSALHLFDLSRVVFQVRCPKQDATANAAEKEKNESDLWSCIRSFICHAASGSAEHTLRTCGL